MATGEKRNHRPLGLYSGLAVFLLPLIVFNLTLAPTVFGLDSAELTTAAATGGLTRATGYPLYLMIGWLWTRLPVGDIGYRMNLLSAVCGALTLLLVDRILFRLGVRTAARLAAVGLLAFSKYFWQLSLIAEVYTLQTAITAGLILALLAWSEKPTSLRLGVVGLVGGLGLSHHMATMLLLPGVIVFLAASHPRQVVQWKQLAAGLGGLALGLSFYLYLPLRYLAQPAFNYAGSYDAAGIFHADNLASLQGIWNLVTGASFAPMMFAYSFQEALRELWQFIVFLSGTFLAVGIGPGLLGFWHYFRRNWKLATMLALMFAGHVFFYINFRAIDKELMYLPAYLIFAIWLGLGYELILSWNDRAPLKRWVGFSKKPVNLANRIVSGIMIGAALFALVFNWHLVDLSKDRSARVYGEEILDVLPAGALYFGYWDSVPVVQYLQLVEGQRPDVQVINRFLISPENMAAWIRSELSRRPVYIDSVPAGLKEDVIVRKQGSIFELRFR